MLISYQAFELAWANTHVYGKCRPFIVHSDDIWFRKPVEVGSMLYFNSQISYTEDNYVQTRVSAEVKGIASLLPEYVDAIAICTPTCSDLSSSCIYVIFQYFKWQFHDKLAIYSKTMQVFR